MENTRLTWDEIKEYYPHQYVGLTDIAYGVNNASIESADEDESKIMINNLKEQYNYGT